MKRDDKIFILAILVAVLPIATSQPLFAQSKASQNDPLLKQPIEPTQETADRPIKKGQSEGEITQDERVQISKRAEELGFDPEKLASIDSKLSDLVQKGKVFGCSALIYRRGEEVYFGKWGYRNQRRKIPLTRDTIFRIYSMSKPITSV
ncbi:MAG: serine hydrolase, partial [Mariniblastus sp.]|nr:serine hydrolase [Mariniblastus sp.]